jgi:hypothetical protein
VQELHRVAVVDLPSQPLNVHLDQIREGVEAVVPDVLGDVGSADDFALAAGEILEERVLLRGELNGAARALDRRARVSIVRSSAVSTDEASAGPRRSSARTRASSSGK